MKPNTGYLVDCPTQAVLTLPTGLAYGDLVQVTGVGAGGWKIAQNAGQYIDAPSLHGVSWMPHESSRDWRSIASSADGKKLAAVADGDRIYTSSASTVPGVSGSLSGSRRDAGTLQYIGKGAFLVLSHRGELSVQWVTTFILTKPIRLTKIDCELILFYEAGSHES